MIEVYVGPNLELFFFIYDSEPLLFPRKNKNYSSKTNSIFSGNKDALSLWNTSNMWRYFRKLFVFKVNADLFRTPWKITKSTA